MTEQRNREVEEAFAQKNSRDVVRKLSRLVRLKCEKQKVQVSALSQTERIPVCLNMFDFEVRNGGFCQFFDNSSGDDWPELKTILEMIGAVETAELLDQALTVFPEKTPSIDNIVRREQLNQMDHREFDILYGLDKKYYSKEENIFALAVEYLGKHKADFS